MESFIIRLENYLQICCKNIQTRFKEKYGGEEAKHTNLPISLFFLWEKSLIDVINFFLIEAVAKISSSKVLKHRKFWGYTGEFIIFHNIYNG